ncbi:MarR family winged helix-turn-helix transcriptional regulator [Vagococcus humatus]|uniref:HTH marR-type domain-containing protein n=1 Tax=Vagococcus humatus TaxID=1889241 RepID=A0A3R9YDF9_9ENTE|nr:MarR family transcriptional regulator [Vagococcus humatus]RST89809.1 hypothetical protein C7P63_01645 [Vagococcus humatus]
MKLDEKASKLRNFMALLSNYLNHIQKKMSGYPFNFNEIRIILDLYDRKTLTAVEIEESLDLDKGYASRLIRNLAEQEVIRKEQSEEDKRSFDLSLTSKGRKIAKELLQAYLNILERDLEKMNDTQLSELDMALSVIQKLYMEIKEQQDQDKEKSSF